MPEDTTRQDDPVRGDDLDEDPEDEPSLEEELDEDPERMMRAWMFPIPRRGRDKDREAVSYREGPRLADLPSGLSKAPFRWEHLERSFDMELLGGFVGVSQDRETLAVRPEIGWAVREAEVTA
jgi:hypothetical protein